MRFKRAAALFTVAVAVACAAPDADAAGFGIYEQGARAMGGAGAFTARADDPSSIYFNPAGLGRIDGQGLLISPNLIYYKSDFSGTAPFPGYGVQEETKGEIFPPFSIYYAQRVSPKVAAGIGVFNPFGLQVEWDDPDQFTGRTISTLSKITPFYLAPTLAWAPSEAWRIGGGANLVFSSVELRRHLQAYNPIDDEIEDIGTLALESETNFGFGFNLGVQWWPSDRMRWGLTWRGEVDVDYEGEADFQQLPTGNLAFDAIVAATFPPDQGVATAVAFPAQLSFGVARQWSGAWSTELDVNWTQWSTFDQLDLRFDQTPALDQSLTQGWDDAFNVRFGLEHRGDDGNAPLAWRAGYYYDESPQPTEGVGPLLPDANRHGLTGGLGWRNASRSTAVDGYILYILANDRSTEGINRDGYDGTYSSNSVVGGVSLGLSFK